MREIFELNAVEQRLKWEQQDQGFEAAPAGIQPWLPGTLSAALTHKITTDVDWRREHGRTNQYAVLEPGMFPRGPSQDDEVAEQQRVRAADLVDISEVVALFKERRLADKPASEAQSSKGESTLPDEVVFAGSLPTKVNMRSGWL